MATRTLSGWTPGNPIDGQVCRVFAGGVLAGTYPMTNTQTSVQVELGSGMNQAVIKSNLEAEESAGYVMVEYTASGERGSETGESEGNPEIPPPTGSITVSNP